MKGSQRASSFAYVFLLGGLDPNNITPFRGYLYNILVATHTLRTTGSQADIVVLIQTRPPAGNNHNHNHNRTLPAPWSDVLESKLGIRLQYLEEPAANDKQSFLSVMLQKFQILKMTQYQRILFLDADIVPFCNLDYLFHASLSGVIQPNLVLAGSDAPAAGNFFLLTPHAVDYDLLETRIVQPTLAQPWNGTRGWGYALDKTDDPPWERLALGGSKFIRHYWPWSWHEKGRDWNFHGGPADQGLLYHWVKYIKRNVTIAIGAVVETWRDNSTTGTFMDRPMLVSRSSRHPLHDMSCRRQLLRKHDYPFRSKEGTKAPYSDYEHNKKIWERRSPPLYRFQTSSSMSSSSLYGAKTPAQFWFRSLQLLDQQLNLQVDWDHWLEHIGNKERPLGTAPKLQDLEAVSSSSSSP
ncbi:hypothetical protein ACA910_021990 [Epithemia clementina (nom. ined.)]